MAEYKFSFVIEADNFDKAKQKMLHPSNLVKIIKNDDNWTLLEKNETDAYVRSIQKEIANQTILDPLIDTYVFEEEDNE